MKRPSDPLELWTSRQLWASTWLLRTRLEFSRRAVSALDHWAISPAPEEWLLTLSLLITLYFPSHLRTLLFYSLPAKRMWVTTGIRFGPSGRGQWLVVEHLSSMPNFWAPQKPDDSGSGSWEVVAHTFNPSCRRAEAEGGQGYTEKNRERYY